MSYKINLGVWGSVFAVPSSVVDKGLKLAGESQLKVLLYILRHNSHALTDESISQALGLHPEDVKDAIEYWTDKGLFIGEDGELSIPDSSDGVKADAEIPQGTSVAVPATNTEEKKISDSPRPVSRPIKPERSYVIGRIKADSNISFLMEEASVALGKLLSQPDMATLIMLHDTDGLPVEVILMLIQHCVDIGKGNMRYIEKTGIAWASEGIDTVSLADEKIKNYSNSTSAWNTVAAVFGMRISGTPTKKQLEFADRWLNEWLFSESMLRFAYERCVDSKGEVSLSYINGILRRWKEASLKTTEDVLKHDESVSVQKTKKADKSQSQSASYDLDAYEKKSIFDD